LQKAFRAIAQKEKDIQGKKLRKGVRRNLPANRQNAFAKNRIGITEINRRRIIKE
jgi:hypothetical protein